MPSFDWRQLRTINGSQQEGFEALCAQLARKQFPVGFEKIGSPDAGVECVADNPSGGVIGWQAKYFSSLGDTQWKQIDSSVKVALEKRNELTRYIVCVPYDRPDARLKDRKSAMDKWNEHVKRWKHEAALRNVTVEFEYWGSQELTEFLLETLGPGVLKFWFDKTVFDSLWFGQRIEEAVKAAGPRYTPELNVALPIMGQVGLFERRDASFEALRALATELADRLSHVSSQADTRSGKKASGLELIESQVANAVFNLRTLRAHPTLVTSLSRLEAEIEEATASTNSAMVAMREEALQHPAHPHDQSSQIKRALEAKTDSLVRLRASLIRAKRDIRSANALYSTDVLIVEGRAGNGKTHLLCDLSRIRQAEGLPTILIMGQRFLTNDEPWHQMSQHLGLPGLSLSEFVDVLEAAAQTASRRALIIIDALNEGTGRSIWPQHLAPFLAAIGRSEWIGVVLSIRSGFQSVVIPADTLNKLVSISHQGFHTSEFVALQAFCQYYGLALPTGPVLNTEFSNPLFLKTICQGLSGTGQKQLPRGSEGITKVFEMYLHSINDTLSKPDRLDYNPKERMPWRAVCAVSRHCAKTDTRWLSTSKAVGLINDLLPGRPYGTSLFKALVDEGLLIEDIGQGEDGLSLDVVYIAYERLADHLIIQALLSDSTATDSPLDNTVSDLLTEMADKQARLSPGLLEALAIQIPERTGQELIDLEPRFLKHWGIADAVCQSIVWRSTESIPEDLIPSINKCIRNQGEYHNFLDTFVQVASLPGHRLNGLHLHEWLTTMSMAERDEVWTVHLHRFWQNERTIKRLVSWASSSGAAAADDEIAELCSLCLMWTFTSSNRYLRDRATKAAVNLLSNRLTLMAKLIEKFLGVNDPYVLERVLATAYGLSMRSMDVQGVVALGLKVYQSIFEAGSPPLHMLLRDYARGVCERALYLNPTCGIVPDLIRPPYGSSMPSIPTAGDIDELKARLGMVSYDSGDVEWGAHRIIYSVEGDDFARYIIGTNSHRTDWLSVELDQPKWQTPQDRLKEVLGTFTPEQINAWLVFKAAEDDLIWKVQSHSWGEGENENQLLELEVPEQMDRMGLAVEFNLFVSSADSLERQLPKGKLSKLLRARKAVKAHKRREAPRFDLSIIQRYIVWRAFELGYSADKFGEFDRFDIGYRGREASKAERIGKKYQWIAYHEILAGIADNYQYREMFSEDGGDCEYVGPWQDYRRDIDPSCLIRSLPGSDDLTEVQAWWKPTVWHKWPKNSRTAEWLQDETMPSVADLLRLREPATGNSFLNLDSFMTWREPLQVGLVDGEVERAEVMLMFTGYLIEASRAGEFLQWAKGVNFWGRWMPEAPELYRVFLGEHGWAPASRYFEERYLSERHGDDSRCPVKLIVCASDYLKEASGFDCSIDSGYALKLPSTGLIELLDLTWSGNAANFNHGRRARIAFDPAAESNGPGSLLVSEPELLEGLDSRGLTIGWSIIGEKRVLAPMRGSRSERPEALEFSGASILVEGFLNCFLSCIKGSDSNE